MWFCGFTPWYGQPWFANFVAKLLQNDEKTLSLIAENPFPGRPPRFVRARLYEYRFTTREERAKTGATGSARSATSTSRRCRSTTRVSARCSSARAGFRVPERAARLAPS